MRIECDITETEREGDYGPVAGVIATCRRCEHETESFGTSDASVARCLVLVREEWPLHESNFYVSAGD